MLMLLASCGRKDAGQTAINVVPRLKRISGVGSVTLMGSNYSMRIWLKPDIMAQYGLVPDDVTTAYRLSEVRVTGKTGVAHCRTTVTCLLVSFS